MRVKILFLISWCIINFISLGQTGVELTKINLDSLQKELPGHSGKERIDVLNKIAFGLSPYDHDSSLALAAQVLNSSREINYAKGMADAQFVSGLTWLFLDSLRPCMTNLLNALRIYETMEPCKELGFTLEQLQAINFLTGRNESSKKYGRRAIEVFRQLNMQLYQVRRTYALALVYTENKEWDSAEYYNYLALDPPH